MLAVLVDQQLAVVAPTTAQFFALDNCSLAARSAGQTARLGTIICATDSGPTESWCWDGSLAAAKDTDAVLGETLNQCPITDYLAAAGENPERFCIKGNQIRKTA